MLIHQVHLFQILSYDKFNKVNLQHISQCVDIGIFVMQNFILRSGDFIL